MGRDNTPKERQQKQLVRKQGGRTSHDRILIVSEGSKTEPNYFREIRAAHRLNIASVEVQPGQRGTAPVQVVQYAKELFEQGDRHKKIEPRAFERVYALFDRDDHNTYFDALRLAESFDRKLKNDTKQPIRFEAIASVPNFELWLLLHYENIQAPLDRYDVMRRLKQHLPTYEKGASTIFAKTRAHLVIATQRSDALALKFTPDSAPEPYTGIAEVVKLLTTLRR